MGLTLRAPASAGSQSIDEGEVRRGLTVLADPSRGVELMRAPSFERRVVCTGDMDAAVASVRDMSPGAASVYWSLNPVSPTLDHNMKTGDALERRWLLIDLDPQRADKGKSNASDEEHERARDKASAVHEDLSSYGWPAPVIIDSGNGFHLLYRVHLPNDMASRVLVRKALDTLARLHGSPEVELDTAVSAANAHSKVPGTWARKGPHSDDRPQRMCRVVHMPDEVDVVGPELLRELAGPEPAPKPAAWGLRLRVSGKGKQAYGRAALDREIGRIRLAGQCGKNRNTALNRAAFALYQLVAGGVLGEGEVESALRMAAREAGLSNLEVESTLGSAKTAGMAQPRGMPEQAPPGANGSHHGNGTAAPDEGQVVIIRASQIEPRQVEWLWPGRIPLGKLTTFAGVGGLGKTFVLCDVAARVSRSLGWPDGQGQCRGGRVLIVSGEDDPDDTLVPRLMEVGADLSRVAFLTTETLDRFTLKDLPTLDRAVSQFGGDVAFVAIDPPTAYLGGVDDHKNSELRQLLSPLKNWAAKHRLALVFNTHITKGSGQKVEAMMRVMGSVAWVNAVRAAHLFTRDPEDEERRFFIGMKSNLAKERKGLAYRLAETRDLARVEWLGEVDVTADQAINRDGSKSRKVVATEWLVERFAEKLEWPSDELFERAKQDGLSRNAVFEAKDRLSLPKARQVILPNGDRRFVWWVPDTWEPPGPKKKTGGNSNTASEEAF